MWFLRRVISLVQAPRRTRAEIICLRVDLEIIHACE